MARRARITTKPPQYTASPGSDAKESETLADKAYQAILQALFDGTIPIGAELSQADLIRLLDVTMQPLRDALRTLENEGIVTIRARACIQFLRTDYELARSTYQFRALIERAGARVLAETGNPKMILELINDHEKLLEKLKGGIWSGDEELELRALEDRLHGALISALRNELIKRTASRLKNYVTLVRLDRLTTRPLAIKTLEEHLNILNACKEQNGKAAAQALSTHFNHALQRLMVMN